MSDEQHVHECTLEPHVHPCTSTTVVFFQGDIVVVDGGVAALVPYGWRRHNLAERIAVLLERHGLVDVPDTAALAGASPWAAPDPEAVRRWPAPGVYGPPTFDGGVGS